MHPTPLEHKFDTTRWSLIHEAQSDKAETRSRALEELARRYHPPVYAFLRRRGLSPHDAADAAQGFFETVILHRDLFGKASVGGGRVRTFVLAALENYLIDLSRRRDSRARAEKARGHFKGFTDEEGRPDLAAPTERDSFERRWAVNVFEVAIERCREHFTATGRAAHWQIFERRVLMPSISASAAPTLADACAAHGFSSPADAAAAVQVVKRRLAALIEQVIAEECDESEVADELAHFREVLGTQGTAFP